MKKLKYYLSGTIFILLCLFDAFFILAAIATISENVGAGLFSLFLAAVLTFSAYQVKRIHNKLNSEIVVKIEEPQYEEEDEEELVDMPLHYYESSSVPQFEIKYQDAYGNLSVRKIAVRKVVGKSLKAHCFLRNEERTFIISRIVECVDLDTGELISGDLRSYFVGRLKNK